MHALPEAVKITTNTKMICSSSRIVTAFEDFDKNTLDNLKMLVETEKSLVFKRYFQWADNCRKETNYLQIHF